MYTETKTCMPACMYVRMYVCMSMYVCKHLMNKL